MKVEQTIQRDSKGPGGHHVVGETRRAQSCADYELLYHEIANIGVLLNEITRTTNTSSESYLPHSLNQNRQYIFNGQVIRLLDFVGSQQNPYKIIAPINTSITPQILNYKHKI